VAKRTDKKRSKKAAAAVPVGERIARLEKALAAGLRREAKAASRLETAQLEVAVLRMALAELVAEASGAPPPAAPARPATPRRSTRPGPGAGAPDR